MRFDGFKKRVKATRGIIGSWFKGFKNRFHLVMAIFFVLSAILSLYATSYYSGVAFAAPTQNPPKGPLQIGLGPLGNATLNNTDVTIDIPAHTIDARVTFRFNQTGQYYIYVMLPYTISGLSAYGIYNSAQYPLSEYYHYSDRNFIC